MFRSRALRSTVTAFVSVLASVSAGVAIAMPAHADSLPADPTNPASPPTVTADALPTVQINGVVWSQTIVGDTVYAGGSFSNARPAGSAAGVNTVARQNFVAYSLSTGVMTSFAPTFNAQVRSVAASPDGSTLYVAGDFTNVNGVARSRVAAFKTSTGELLPFAPNVGYQSYAIAATATTVYVGGNFSSVGASTRQGVAAFNATTGALLPWAPSAVGGKVTSLVVSPDATKVVFGGQFTTVNGSSNPGYGLAAVDAVSGNLVPFAANSLIRNGGNDAGITSLSSRGDSLYGSGYVFGNGGNLEGAFRARWTDGSIVWVDDCHGDTYSVYPDDKVVYEASHKHYCGNIGGFPQTEPTWTFYRATAVSQAATGTATADPYGYYNYAGTPSPTLLNWFPQLNTGSATGQSQGPWQVTGNGTYVVMGGEFTQVNGVGQQGLVRYAVTSKAPNKVGPQYTTALTPSAVSLTSGTVRVAWSATSDKDNENLTYTLVRDGKTATPIYTTTVASTFWKLPALGFKDTGLAPGSTHTYKVYVTDPSGNQTNGSTTTVTVSNGAAPGPYVQDVVNDGALDYWRLGESSGATAYDWAGYTDAKVGTGVTRGAVGAINGDANTASSFDGTNNGLVVDPVQQKGPDSFGLETWIKTTSTAGGKIIGFGNTSSGESSNYDRHVYMDADGRIWFGVWVGSAATLNTGTGYNDGQWHHIVANMGPGGMSLYVDGKRAGQRSDITVGQAYSGYWRIGGDTSWNGANYFTGTIDDVAIYPAPLTRQQVITHWVDSGRTSALPTVPADAYGAAIYGADPDLYWRLGETSGTVAADAGLNANAGTYNGASVMGRPGALNGVSNTAVRFNGSNGFVSTKSAVSGPSVYSEELWFSTTTTQGGKLIGFGDQPTGTSSSYDRHVYMQDDGRLVFGTWTGQMNTITSAKAYNDGAWHHMVATQSGAGMVLYVDGQSVGTNPQTAAQGYNGYWRVGGDVTWGSSSNFFAGTIDEVAVYPVALTAATVQQHYVIGSTGQPANQAPTASFTQVVTNLKADFDASGSSDADGSIASYAWDFGDSSTGTGVTPSHTYTDAGTYTVVLTVTDNKGATAQQSAAIQAVEPPNVKPTASFTADKHDLTVDLDGSASSDSDGTIASYAWDFGDGTTGTGSTSHHTYATGGDKTIKLTVTDNRGGTDTASKTVTVVAPNQLPTAAFTSDVTLNHATFDASGSTDPDGTIQTYAWDFGDGSAAGSGKTPDHTYGAVGSYTVKLTVTDDRGGVDTASHSVTVASLPVNQKPTASFTRTLNGLVLSVNGGASSDPDGTIASYSWDFGDGTPAGSGKTATHTYSAAGTYQVKLTVTDDGGATDSSTASIDATGPTVFAADAFGRTSASGWGNADQGGAWTLSGSASNFAVAGGVGTIKMGSAGAGPGAALTSVSSTDTEIGTTWSVDKTADGGGLYLTDIVRRVSSTTFYQAKFRLVSTSAATLIITKVSAGTETTLASTTVTGLTVGANEQVRLRVQATGTAPTTLRAKAWKIGATEPASWQVQTTDSTAGLQVAGAVGVQAYLSGSATTAPVVAKLDDVWVGSSGA